MEPEVEDGTQTLDTRRICPDEIERAIHIIRGQRVMLDADLAKLYGVTTGRLNEQVQRNRDRLPVTSCFSLRHKSLQLCYREMRFQAGWRDGCRTRRWAFTEQGVAMLSMSCDRRMPCALT